jgi:hypothetical protein
MLRLYFRFQRRILQLAKIAFRSASHHTEYEATAENTINTLHIHINQFQQFINDR